MGICSVVLCIKFSILYKLIQYYGSILNKLVWDGSVAYMECGGLGNGLLSCGRPIEPPHSLRSLRGLACPFSRWSQPISQPT